MKIKSRKDKKILIKQAITEKGITLIALVVTIVVLLILAGITITMVLGEDGILSQAKLAAQKTKEAEEQQEKDLQDLAGMINEAVNGKDPDKLEDAVSSKKVFSHTTGYDSDGNKVDGSSEEKKAVITIPAGFKITEGDLNSIDQGVVISDEAGNEFVWVPCESGEYKAHTYTGDHSKDNEENSEDEGEVGWNTWYYGAYKDWTGDKDQESKNKESVAKYGGFYIARYEAGIPSNASFYVNSASQNKTYTDATQKDTSKYAPVSKKGVQAWNYISQTNAKSAAEGMYRGNTYVTSQLVDGIAWDRTVDWIVANSGVEGIEKDSTNYGNYANTSEDFKKPSPNNGESYQKLRISSPILFAEHLFEYEYKTENGIDKWEKDIGWRLGKNYQYGNIETGYTEPYNSLEDAEAKYSDFSSNTANRKYRHYIELSTGASEDTKLNNIYDLAGNMYEWTTETGYHKTEDQTTPTSSSTQYTVLRGGGFTIGGTNDPVSMRNGSFAVGDTDPSFGFRVVLYVK